MKHETTIDGIIRVKYLNNKPHVQITKNDGSLLSVRDIDLANEILSVIPPSGGGEYIYVFDFNGVALMDGDVVLRFLKFNAVIGELRYLIR